MQDGKGEVSKMSDIDLEYLFTPGAGGVPPYLAGRKEEKEYFQRCVKALKNRKPIRQDLIIYGPRGNGKTALLGYLQKETLRKEGSKIDILWETPNEMETLTELSDRLIAGKPKIQDWFQSVEVSASAGVVAGKAQLGKPRQKPTTRELLEKRSQHKPFILIIDEAHRLKPPIAEALLNASQKVRTMGAPFLLVLAGTPNLEATLGKANASFWDRGKIFPLGRLSCEEARQAITVPLEKAGIFFAPDAVEEVVERSHCYPYFVQIWGDCLARKLSQTGETEITMNTVKEVQKEAIANHDKMYRIRRNEIDRTGLLSVAERIADAFMQSGQPYLHGSILKEAIKDGLACDDKDEPVTNESILEKLDQLFQLGYVWQLEGADYEPGIPSLMSYVREYSLPPTRRGRERSLSSFGR